MKTMVNLAVAALLVLGLAAPAAASEEVTLSGTIVCAKCKLNKTEKCQDALVVTQDQKTTEYFITKNATAEDAGHQCKTEMKATVTGVVSEKDGTKWITASKIVKS